MPLENSESRPLFIVLEGIDGSGTTTQGDRLTAWLRSKGIGAHFTHEPSNGPAGMLIRLALSKRLLGSNFDYHDPLEDRSEEGKALDAYTLALLYASDRMDHLATEVNPNLRRGRFVICDRYVLSTLAYQGMSVEEQWLVDINRHARKADLTIYLDVPVEHARQRMRKTRWTRDLYEGEEELRRIYDRYSRTLRQWSSQLGPLVLIDGTKSVNTVHRLITGAVEQFMMTGRAPGIAQSEGVFVLQATTPE